MLIVMTFNVGLLIASTMGLGIGSLFFNSIFEMPEMPPFAIFTEKKGDYEPNPDPCCSKADASSLVVKRRTSKVMHHHH